MINTQLLRKEIALQRTNLMFLAGIVLFWVVLVAASFFRSVPIGYERFTVGDVVQIVNCLGVVSLLTVFLPVMMGASAVSSERRLETFDWQMSLPKGRMRQWATKSFVVLALAFASGGVLAWGLTWLLSYTLNTNDSASRNARILPAWLFGGLWPGFFAMFFAAAGLYVSTLTRDAYKALIGAMALLVLTFYGMRYVIDPTGLLWPYQSFDHPVLYSRPTAHYLVLLCFALFVLYVGYRNFGFEHVSRRRFAWQMVIWIIAANVTGWYLLRWEFNTPYVSDDRGGPVRISNLIGSEGPKPWARAPFNPVRLPGTTRLVVDPTAHVLDVDVLTGNVRQRPNVSGSLDRIDPAGKGYTVGPWVVTDFPIALNTETWIGRVLLSRLSGTAQFAAWGAIEPSGPSARFSTYVDENGARHDQGYVQWEGRKLSAVDDIKTGPARTYLLRKTDTSSTEPRLLDAGRYYYEDWCVSPDEEWYTRHSSTTGSLEVMRVDQSTSYTLEPRGGTVCVAPGPMTSCWMGQIGQKYYAMPVSKDGRYLAFIRTTPLKEAQIKGKETCQGFPESIQIALLDLRSGQETTVTRVGPSPVASAFQAAFAHRIALGKVFTLPRIPLAGRAHGRECTYVQLGLPMAWSDDGKLAALDDGLLYVCEPRKDRSGFNAIQISVPADVTNLDFFNNEALLIWGEHGLWRVDLPKSRISSIVAGTLKGKGVKVLNQ